MSKSTKPDDGGPAFAYGAGGSAGMSLRTWLAGQALVGAIGTCAVPIGDENAASVAKACCKLADALLAELALQENQDAETQQ